MDSILCGGVWWQASAGEQKGDVKKLLKNISRQRVCDVANCGRAGRVRQNIENESRNNGANDFFRIFLTIFR